MNSFVLVCLAIVAASFFVGTEASAEKSKNGNDLATDASGHRTYAQAHGYGNARNNGWGWAPQQHYGQGHGHHGHGY